MKRFVILFLALALPASVTALAACGPATNTEPEAETRGENGSAPEPSVTRAGDTIFLELPVGRSADNGEITVTFDAVTEDSRCPRDVECVWQGNAGVRLTLSGGDEASVYVLGSAREPHEVVFEGYTVTFRDLEPYPVSDRPIDRDAYVARIAVVEAR
ncbi:MAG TPA: hypothetical protein VFQ22_13190 [Longimicrobiales bacterium]|nr:hypothetical protein [Longimicrobiales bacterium]